MAATVSILHRFNRAAARSATLAIVLACALAGTAPPARGADDDMPARVGRIADFGGAVHVAPEDRANEWAEVGLNYPVVSGDNLWVSGDGRAEVDVGGGRLRLAGDTNVHLSRIDDRELSLFVAQGRVIVRLDVLDPGEVARVDTPNTQVTLLRPGLYRIEVSNDRQETTLVVREGEATAAVTNGLQQVLPGQTATLFGDQDVQADVRNGTGLDGFDTWSADRDRYYRANRSAAYVSPQMVGAADLEQYGAWQTYPEYGAVWFPSTVDAGWAPYRHGRWVSLSGWGLTWVDDAPWGYAPFHYGRWAFIGGRWGWCPGRFVARPVWAPALVAWYGGGGGAVGGYGPVYGWVPLGWRDPYIPAWRNCSNRCWNNYNRPYAVNVAERPRQRPTHYVNYQVPGAVTAMSGAAFVSGKPVAVNRVNLPGGQLSGLPPLSNAPQVKPLPITTNRVRPGNGAPIPASSAYGTTQADGGVAAAPGHLRARRSGAAMGQTGAGVQRGRIAATELRSALTRSAGAKHRRKAATHRARLRRRLRRRQEASRRPRSRRRIRSMSRHRIQTAPCPGARARRRRWRRIAAGRRPPYVPMAPRTVSPAQPRAARGAAAFGAARADVAPPGAAAPTRDVGPAGTGANRTARQMRAATPQQPVNSAPPAQMRAAPPPGPRGAAAIAAAGAAGWAAFGTPGTTRAGARATRRRQARGREARAVADSELTVGLPQPASARSRA